MSPCCKTSDAVSFGVMGIVLFAVSVFLRPLMPIDETRYLSVAWEMWQHKGWFDPLTKNFEPYSHKPPLLFWLINLSWGVFGVSRWAALLPVLLMAFVNIYLVGILYKKLFADAKESHARWIMFGSVPFFFYSTLMLFDMSMCVFAQLGLLALLNFTKDGRMRWMIAMGLAMGFGVLMKGPVAYLYVLFPVLFGPLWKDGNISKGRWYGGFLIAFLVSAIPVLAWLIPVLTQSDNKFAFWLVWNQTAGRVTGNFSASHARPFYFYFMLAPLLVLPWAFFPSFWKGWKMLDHKNTGLRFLFFWFVPTFVSFCLISGKQAHYLVPLMPAVTIFIAEQLRGVSRCALHRGALVMTAVFAIAHAVAYKTVFPSYDMQPMADAIQPYKGGPIAFAYNYHAEISFLGRMEHGVDELEKTGVQDWFRAHPDGVAMIRIKKDIDYTGLKQLAIFPYRGEQIGLYKRDMEP